MDLKINSIGKSGIEKYKCIYSKISSNMGELFCDTSGNPINTTVEDLHLSTGNSSDSTFILVKMKDGLNNKTSLVASGENKYSYKRSSSGLSGGAIAGIVIACVVVLAGVSIAIILLRKSTPHLENTIAIDLKNESNMEKI